VRLWQVQIKIVGSKYPLTKSGQNANKIQTLARDVNSPGVNRTFPACHL